MNLETFVANGQAAQAAADKVIVTFQASANGSKRVKSVKPAPFINEKAVREFLLEHAGKTRAHKYTRVSEQTMIEISEMVRRYCIHRVASLPSKGKTI